MGDRGNIYISHNTEGEAAAGVWLYSHWGGSRLLETAIKGVLAGRVGDPDYLTRTIFCNMVADGLYHENGTKGFHALELEEGDDLASSHSLLVGQFADTTGYGIGLRGAGDQEHPTVCVDGNTGTIWLDADRPTSAEDVCAPEDGKVIYRHERGLMLTDEQMKDLVHALALG